MFPSTSYNVGSLIKFTIRKDRIRIPLWLIGIIFFTVLIPVALDDMFPTQEERDVMAETMANPAMTAMVGPGDIENYTIGAMTTHNMLLFTAVVVGLMSILLVIRHTRTEEEDGLSELILALPVGRLANLNATLFVLTVTHIILALISGFSLYALGLDSMDLEGSLLYGAVLGGTGIFFTGIAAVSAQISESSRGATGLSIAALLLAYFIRAIGDVSNETLSLFSPLGLVTRTEAYSTNVWWPVLLLAGFSALLFLLANYLNAIRDWGAAFLHARAGKTYASRFLQTPIGLFFRTQRTAFISWGIGMFVLGLSYGSIMGDLESFFQGNELLEQMLVAEEGYSLTEQFIPALMIVMGILATVPPIIAMNKLIGEEKKNRTESILAAPVSRGKLMASNLAIAVMNGFIMISLSGIGLFLAAETVMEDGFSFGMIYGASLVFYPAMLVMISFSAFLIGFAPKLTGLIWVYVVFSFITNYLGGLLDFPAWVEKLSPFGYIPAFPVENMEWAPIVMLSLIAIILAILGFIGYQKRDIAG
ncbi:ABC transporter permease [Oceanobacillus alkalisoli]|uniref:ABC transporter permease n=1 Tax=Oceanobacillus alkalisoli TaxID=2925113 RepID=UPI001EE3CDA0|nr:ABC transporter permease [Oceanobacillus alkalisoli]MCG5104927.1 ABC transporter permease [Oceanobacillus alkalisoli]